MCGLFIMIDNIKEQYDKSLMTCLFTKDDWEIWERISERNRNVIPTIYRLGIAGLKQKLEDWFDLPGILIFHDQLMYDASNRKHRNMQRNINDWLDFIQVGYDDRRLFYG